MSKIKRRSLTGGEVFGRLTVIGLSHSSTRKDGSAGERVMLCECDCGNRIKVRTSNLYSGNTKSCGCFHSAQTIKANIARTATIDDIEDHMAFVCDCGSVKWVVLKSAWLECHACRKRIPPPRIVEIN